jgi:hypothetical protein
MKPPLCTCLELFPGRQLHWDSFANFYCADCGR